MADLVRRETHSQSRFAQTQISYLNQQFVPATLTLHSVVTEQNEGPTDTVASITDSETIKPYWPRNMPSLSTGRLHLSFKGCQVSCFILILFRIFPVRKLCSSAASDLGLLCFPVSILWDARYIWFNTVRFYCISGNHRHVFPDKSANQHQLSYFYSYFCNAKRNKASEFAYQIGQFTGIQSIPGSAFRGCI